MKFKKALALALSCALTVSLAACTQPDAESSPSGSESPSPSAGADTDSVTLPDGFTVEDYVQTVAGVEPDTVLFTVNGADVTAEFFLYWLSYDCSYWESMLGSYGMPLDFSEELEDGVTAAQYIKDDAQQMAAAYVLMEQAAAEHQCGATEAQLAEWEQYKVDQLGSDGTDYDIFLAQLGLRSETLDRIGMVVNGFLYSNLTDALIDDPTQEELDQYAADNQIYQAKHILICTAVESEDGTVTLTTGSAPTNEDGTPFTGTAEEYNAAARAKIDDILDQIEGADDPLAKFDELMQAHSEDGGLATNPDGYTFTPATSFVDEFKDAVYGLEIDAWSGVVESAYGYHILLRLRPDVTESCRADRMSDLVNSWLDEAEIVTTETYDNLDAETFYTAYAAYQQSLQAALTPAEPEPEPSDSAQPDGTPEEGGAG